MQSLPQDEVELVEPSLEIARQVKEQDVQVDEEGRASLIKGVAKIGASVSKTPRCVMVEKVGVCVLMDTSGHLLLFQGALIRP